MQEGASQADIVRRAQAGDPEAFRDLYRESWRPLLAYVASQVPDADEARSVTQAALVEAWKSISTLREPGRFGGWLRTIAMRQAIRWWEARGGRAAPTPLTVVEGEGRGAGAPSETGRAGLLHAADPAAADPADAAERAEFEGALLEALEEFPPLHREAILLRLMEGVTYREIAERLGLGLDQVKGAVTRGIVKLAGRLRGFLPGEDP